MPTIIYKPYYAPLEGVCNPSPTDAVPVMTGYTTAGVTVNGTADLNPSYPAWAAFDAYISSTFVMHSPTGYIRVIFPAQRIIGRYNFYSFDSGRYPKTWNFEGSNDGSTWTILHSVVGAGNPGPTYSTFDVPSPQSFYQYRINVLQSNDPNYVSFGDIQLFECMY